MLDDVRRVREDSRGDDASEVVREVVFELGVLTAEEASPKFE